MGVGVVYKCVDGKSWAKSTVMDTGNTSTTFDAGKVRHCDDGVVWYDNYPMEKPYEQYFNATWTQSYNESGVKLDTKVHGDHLKAGDTYGFIGMWGFNNTDIKKFVADGVITSLMIEVMYDTPADNHDPTVYFAAHDRKTEPNVADFLNIWESFKTTKVFNSASADYKTWVTLPVDNWLDGEMGGVAVWGASDTVGNYARFAGKTTSNGLNGFNTRLFVKVLK